MLTNTDKKIIEKAIKIIQAEITAIFDQYESKKSESVYFIDNASNNIRLLIECRNRLKNYFINGLN